MTYEEILSHFQVKKYGNGKVQALCPAHPDKEASLTITQGNNGRILLKCHAGCSSERLVYEKNTAAYQIADQEERITRRTETDVIKEFVEYARAQGSTHADHYYSNYTRLAYKSVGITDKTTAAGSQLDDLSLVEHLIAHTLRTGMAAGRNYKDIYQDCKNRLEAMRYIQCTA